MVPYVFPVNVFSGYWHSLPPVLVLQGVHVGQIPSHRFFRFRQVSQAMNTLRRFGGCEGAHLVRLDSGLLGGGEGFGSKEPPSPSNEECSKFMNNDMLCNGSLNGEREESGE